MNAFFKGIKFFVVFLMAVVANGVIIFLLKFAELTTLGALGVYALILTIIPGTSLVREKLQYVEFRGQKIDFWFLSSVAVAFVSIPVAVMDKASNIHDRWGYGTVGFIVLLSTIFYHIVKFKCKKTKKAP
ncbi:hypothetical protein [Pseudescherichia sp.]|uniref:hypothetical protein n=1 Tax=Pseudescherichia sp. TaxID=2055881 RepID=UPI0028A2A74D|nr:hypothetical protein [Pseudescherichia sp.]